VTVDSRERELLAELFGVAVVGVDIDRAFEEERFVKTVQLVLNRLGCPLYAFLNHENRPPTTSIVDALRNCDIVPVLWSLKRRTETRVGGLSQTPDTRTVRMKLRGLVLIVLGGALAVWSAVGYVREVVAVDSCLDAGGSFDYAQSRCDRAETHPFVAY
jgi:hypothetical protein